MLFLKQTNNNGKANVTKAVIKIIFNYIIKPQVKIDTVIKRKNIDNKTLYQIKFIVTQKRQPFIHTADYLFNNIDKFNFSKDDILLIAYYHHLQNFENCSEENAC